MLPERQAELLALADRLDATLARAKCDRTAIYPFVHPYLHATGDHANRLRKTRRAADALPGSWLGSRGQFAEKLTVVRDALEPVLVEEMPEEELRFLLGWVLRLARIRKPRG